jgi:predicted membrane channel-forming protein YqfA (hemolysin III family)
MTDQATSPAPRATRIAFLVWGAACYAVFFACFLYAIAFIGDFGFAPKTVDSGEPGPLGLALAVDLGLLSLFAVQHSGFPRRPGASNARCDG